MSAMLTALKSKSHWGLELSIDPFIYNKNIYIISDGRLGNERRVKFHYLSNEPLTLLR